MNGYLNFENENGFLKTVLSTNEEEREYIEDSIAMNSDMSDEKIDKIFKYFNEKILKVGFIVALEVKETSKGNGVGRKFMDCFKSEVMEYTDVDILLARTQNKQSEGFNLELFYEKYGFKGVALEDGDMLMVSKGYENILDDLLNLKEERKYILSWFKEHGVGKHQATKDFLEKKEQEQSLINKPKRNKSKIKRSRQKI